MAIKVALKELCTIEITDGTHKTPEYSDQGYIFLSSKNVTSEKIDWKNVMYIPESLHQELYQRLAPQKDDILLAKNGTTGVAAIVDRDEVFDIYVSLALIRPNQKKVIPRYLLYAINSDSTKRYFRSHLKGVGVPNLHLIHIRETPINVPNIQAQLQIVKKLDKVSDLIAKRRQQLDKLDTLVKARFVEMFGDFVYDRNRWQICEIGDVADTIDPQPSHRTPPISSDGVPYIGIAECNYKTHFIDFDKARKVGQNVLMEHLERYSLSEGDFIIGKIGTIGKPFFIPAKQNYTLSANTVLIKPIKDKVVPQFLFAIFQSEYMGRIIDAEKKSTSQPAFGIQKVRRIEIPMPPMALQEQFAAFGVQVDKLKLAIQRSCEALETLKKALMQKYFK